MPKVSLKDALELSSITYMIGVFFRAESAMMRMCTRYDLNVDATIHSLVEHLLKDRKPGTMQRFATMMAEYASEVNERKIKASKISERVENDFRTLILHLNRKVAR